MEADRALKPEELPDLPGGHSLYICAPADRAEAEALKEALESGANAGTLRLVFPPEDDIDVAGATVRSTWLLDRLAEAAKTTVPFMHQDGPFGGIVARAMEGKLLPLFVHNVNNLMVGAMGNIDLATLFSRDSNKCQAKLKDASAAMRRLSDFMADLGAVSQPLPEPDSPADWSDLQMVLTMGRLACGRSVNMTLEPESIPGSGEVCPNCRITGRTLRVVCSCILTAALTSVRGCGEISLAVESERPSVRVAWSRGQQDTGRYGAADNVVISMLAALSATPPCCASLIIPRWDEEAGEALLLPGPAGS